MTTTADLIYQNVQTMPEALAKQVLDFSEYLQTKWQPSFQTGKSNSLQTLLETGIRTSKDLSHHQRIDPAIFLAEIAAIHGELSHLPPLTNEILEMAKTEGRA